MSYHHLRMSTIVLVLSYPTFVEIDLNEVQDTGNWNDEMQTIEYKSCSKRLVLNKDCLLYRSKDHFHWTGPLYPLPHPPVAPPMFLGTPKPRSPILLLYYLGLWRKQFSVCIKHIICYCQWCSGKSGIVGTLSPWWVARCDPNGSRGRAPG